MTVEALGEPWSTNDVDLAAIDTTWVHAASLLRSDFPCATLRHVVDRGHRLAFDGQGLVRVPQLGALVVDAAYDRAELELISMLKLADEEAEVVARGTFDERAAKSLGIAEILVTYGSDGCDLYVEGERDRVPAAWVVSGVHTTGAGDAFTVAYVAARARAQAPAEAASSASELVAEMLQARRAVIPAFRPPGSVSF